MVLLKPQFEVVGAALSKGILKSSRLRREVILDFEKWLRANGFVVLCKRDSGVAGRFGNRERFYYLGLEARGN
jgi:predicted rRNA methylase YqxC with S4 and FtsJ domains